MSLPPGVTVAGLLSSRPEAFGLPLELLAGVNGLDRLITSPHIQKTGLALAGFHEYLKPGRVLIFGESEIRYLESLESAARCTSLRLALTLDFPCVLITGGFTPPIELLTEAALARVPLLKTNVATPTAIAKLSSILEDSLAERTMIHAVLMDVLGVGILLLGKSGIGKSEAALDLIMRGHRLVADDLVEVRRTSGDVLVGWASELIKHHMEVRGLGIINIKDMFGVAAVRDDKKIELVIELVRWDQAEAHDRLGLDEMVYPILDVPTPLLRIPVSPGRNVSSLIEVAARNRLLQVRGHHSAREFQERLDRALADARDHRWRDDVE